MGCRNESLAPWRATDAPASPMSFVAGLVIVAIGVAGVAIGTKPVVAAWILVGLAVAVVIIAGVLVAHGHRVACAVPRALWYAVCVPGLPIRLLAFV